MTDDALRQQALDPRRSFIVQAPAGSGKTELLIQRYLRLLSTVDAPEEIIAITFTRKAAAEMRARILSALRNTETHELIHNPNRLRILTIDALAARLCAQMPLSTGFGAQPKISEDAESYYEKAAHALLTEQRYQDDVEKLLLHLDNNADQLILLFIEMLAHRDQWLPHIVRYHQNSNALRRELEKGLKNIAEEKLTALSKILDTNQSISIHDLPQWITIADSLLTKTGEWRKRPKKAEYQESPIFAPLNELSGQESLRVALYDLTQCPPLSYSDQQWTIIHALVRLLPLLTAELNLIFQEENVIDFTELTFGAMRALGNASDPTDLALRWDYQIRHLLIDEFQDTSLTQFRFIEQLTAGWQPDEGRTLFLVGDPMQSIYRFRNAEVSLFNHAKNNGVGNIRLTSLTLSANFRSQPSIVDWINRVFQSAFPQESNSLTGAISYAPSLSKREPQKRSGVKLYPLLNAEPENEAEQIIKIIHQYQHEDPHARIAVLVRSRNQLRDIIPVLKAAGIAYHAVEIEKLGHRVEIRDLFSLTQALCHLNDRIAWLSVLRAPWCGLTLNDLHAIAHYRREKLLWENLQNFQAIANLSNDGKKRLDRIVPILSQSLHNHGILPLATWIEGSWLALGGPACLKSEIEITNARAYFRLLETLETDFDIRTLAKKLDQLYAQMDDNQTHGIQIMTIHKAKGLEFDHVIIPSLHRKTPPDKNRLLMWLDRPTAGGSDLILAPIKFAYEDNDPIYDYLRTIEKSKLTNEAIRLFYVAATRAKSSLHLLMRAEETPLKATFMDFLWPSCKEVIAENIISTNNDESLDDLRSSNRELIRLCADWQLPVEANKGRPEESAPNTFGFSLTAKNYLGTAIHEALETVAHEGISQWDIRRIEKTKPYWKRRLQQLGTPVNQLEASLVLLEKALLNTLNDQRGQWILSQHQDSQNEYSLRTPANREIAQVVLDRTFVDNENMRWIIDYKTATPDHESDEVFLQQQSRQHAHQLNRYAEIMQKTELRPIKLGIYFPLCSLWMEWGFVTKP